MSVLNFSLLKGNSPIAYLYVALWVSQNGCCPMSIDGEGHFLTKTNYVIQVVQESCYRPVNKQTRAFICMFYIRYHVSCCQNNNTTVYVHKCHFPPKILINLSFKQRFSDRKVTQVLGLNVTVQSRQAKSLRVSLLQKVVPYAQQRLVHRFEFL